MTASLVDILQQPITLPDFTPLLHKTKTIAQEVSRMTLQKTFPNTMMAYHHTPSNVTTRVEHYTYLDGLTFDFIRAFVYVHIVRCAFSLPEFYEYIKKL